jgi:hypothetical protein
MKTDVSRLGTTSRQRVEIRLQEGRDPCNVMLRFQGKSGQEHGPGRHSQNSAMIIIGHKTRSVLDRYVIR